MTLTPRSALLLILCLLGLATFPAHAQARRATAPIGNAKEDDEPKQPAGRPTPGPEVALLRGILAALDTNPVEVRTQAIEDLGLLQDPRALNLLAQLVLDPNPAVWRAAMRAVALIRHPRAEEILANVVRHPTLSESHKLLALEFLPFQNTSTALRFIAGVTRTTSLPNAVQNLGRRIMLEVPLARGGTL